MPAQGGGGNAPNGVARLLRPERITSVWQRLEQQELVQRCRAYECREAGAVELQAVHSVGHYDALMATAEGQQYPGAASDLYFCAASAAAARIAAGALVDLALAVLRGEVANGFALIRPPGMCVLACMRWWAPWAGVHWK